MRILLSVEESAGIQAIRAAGSSGHEVVAVLTSNGGAKSGRLGATVEDVATHLGYPVWPAQRVKDPAFATVLRDESVDLLLNVHSLYLIHGEVLSAARVGAFNLHPGPLPQYAGMNAPSWAILNGEPNHGVTLHWMDPGIDTGPIAFDTRFDLAPDDTGLRVSSRCSRLGLELIENLLSADPADIPRRQQAVSGRQYHGFEVPFDGKFPWQSAPLAERFVRASNFYPLPSPWGIPTIPYRDEAIGLIEVSVTGEKCDAPAGTVTFRDGKCCLATDDQWLELNRVLHRSKLVAGGELPG